MRKRTHTRMHRNSHHGSPGWTRRLTEHSGQVASDIKELGHVAVVSAGHAAANLRAKGRNALKAAGRAKVEVQDFVAENPVKSVLIAMGVGAVVGYLLHRRG